MRSKHQIIQPFNSVQSDKDEKKLEYKPRYFPNEHAYYKDVLAEFYNNVQQVQWQFAYPIN